MRTKRLPHRLVSDMYALGERWNHLYRYANDDYHMRIRKHMPSNTNQKMLRYRLRVIDQQMAIESSLMLREHLNRRRNAAVRKTTTER